MGTVTQERKCQGREEGCSAERTSLGPATFWPFPARVTHPLQHQDGISSFEFISPKLGEPSRRKLRHEKANIGISLRFHLEPAENLETDSRKDLELELDLGSSRESGDHSLTQSKCR